MSVCCSKVSRDMVLVFFSSFHRFPAKATDGLVNPAFFNHLTERCETSRPVCFASICRSIFASHSSNPNFTRSSLLFSACVKKINAVEQGLF